LYSSSDVRSRVGNRNYSEKIHQQKVRTQKHFSGV
jgi:hypothetical protein